MVAQETVDGWDGGRFPVGVSGAASVPGDACSGCCPCRRKPHVLRANGAPRDCRLLAIGDMLAGLHAAGWLRTFVLRSLT